MRNTLTTLTTPLTTLRRSFMNTAGLPTPAYRTFLVEIIKEFRTFTPAERQQIRDTLMHWEEEALTGIMHVGPSDPVFATYDALLKAVFTKVPFQRGDGLDLANSTVVHLIAEVEKGCSYAPCYRKNPLHRELMHSFTNSSNRPFTNNRRLNRSRRSNTHRSNTHRSTHRPRSTRSRSPLRRKI